MKKKIIAFLVFTFLASSLAYTNGNDFMSFVGDSFLIAGFSCMVAIFCNKYIYALSALIICVSGIIGGGVESGIITAVILIGAFVCGNLIKDKVSVSKLILSLAVTFFASAVMLVVYKSYTTGLNVVSAFLESTKENFVTVFEEYMKIQGQSDVEININQVADSVYTVIQNIIPALAIMVSLINGFLSLIVVSFLCRILRAKDVFRVTFSEFSVDKTTIVVFILSLVLSYALKSGVVMTASVNIFLILLFVLQICGLSVFDYKLKKRGLITPIRFLIMVFALVFLTGILPMIIFVGTGILDAFKDFRQLSDPEDN